jgi:hypothetical protein
MVIKKDILEDGNKNCPWKWIQLKQESSSLEEAKEWLNENIDLVLGSFELYHAE